MVGLPDQGRPDQRRAMKLLLDGMLGRLAKWLRLLGHDTAYLPDLDDNELVRQARAQGRILLTRDRELTRRRGLNCLLIESDELEEQLHQVVSELRLETKQPFSRCPVCNTPLQQIEKSLVKTRVPPYVFRTKEHFSLCPGCDRIYWRGTHWANMRQEMARIQSGLPTQDPKIKKAEAAPTPVLSVAEGPPDTAGMGAQLC